MDSLLKRFRELKLDGGLISLEFGEIMEPYFCYPRNAQVIGFEGAIMYCLIPEAGELVFAVNPESCAEQFVYPVAKSFDDFLCLILACGSTNPIEQIVWMSREQFNLHLDAERKIQTAEQLAVLEMIKRTFGLRPMQNPFDYVKALQASFDGTVVQYREEYYEVLGLECPIDRM